MKHLITTIIAIMVIFCLSSCKGSGKKVAEEAGQAAFEYVEKHAHVKCQSCGGDGIDFWGNTCDNCGGDGWDVGID